MDKNIGGKDTLYHSVRQLISNSRQQVVKSINHQMVLTYFEIGRIIVEYEQDGNSRAAYSKQTINNLSKQLTKEFGRGFSSSNLENMRKFYLIYAISQTVSGISKSDKIDRSALVLSWSHYCFLIRISNLEERRFYEIESYKNNWSLRELKRQFNAALYDRLKLSRDKDQILKLSQSGQIVERPEDLIKNPYILEFLNLNDQIHYSEKELETAIIDKLQAFLLELGKGFTFVGRQVRISFSEKHFKIDLVFYNRLLRCFFLLDLKIGELSHKDIGQMQMYVNYYDREVKLEDENKTIGLLLCKVKDDAVVEYTLPQDNDAIFTSQYQTVLPDKDELRNLVMETEVAYGEMVLHLQRG